MTAPHQPIRSARDAEEAQKRRDAADLWRKTGMFAADPAWIRNDWDRQMVKNIAERLYGKRNGAMEASE